MVSAFSSRTNSKGSNRHPCLTPCHFNQLWLSKMTYQFQVSVSIFFMDDVDFISSNVVRSKLVEKLMTRVYKPWKTEKSAGDLVTIFL